jgi:uncharacterized glyoxalase superfamily protein PhnB
MLAAYASTMTPRFDAVGMVVADMAATLAFYRLLGIDIPAAADSEPHVEAVMPGGVRFLWDTVETIQSFDSAWSRPTGGPGISLAFGCDSPAEVDATYAMLVAAGAAAHLEPWDAFWGQRYATLRDPDGNGVDLFAALPVS